MSGSDHDYEGLLWAESADLGSLLDELEDGDFDHASLCDGWRVRDVMSHMIVGHTTPMAAMLTLVARKGFNVPKASLTESVRYGSTHSPDQIRTAWRGVVEDRTMRGIAKVIPTREAFVDHLIHHQDIRRPLARPRSIPADRLAAALDAMPRIGGFVKSKQRMAGLRWHATDIDWAVGEGPEVSGPAEALVLLASGRPSPIQDVSGPGVEQLRTRVTA